MSSLLPQPRFQLTVPSASNSTSRLSTHAHASGPQSAPPGPSRSSVNHGPMTMTPSRSQTQPPAGRGRFMPPPPVRKRSVPLAARSAHPLQEQIDRLTATCEEHERIIRSTLSTIKHHLLTNIPPILDRLNKADEDAEAITSSLHQALQTHIPPFQAHLRQVLLDRANDVELMRLRTTPWRDVVNEKDEQVRSTLLADGERSVARLERIAGAEGGEGVNALSRIELWSDEVSLYLSSEIVRAKERLANTTSKRRFLLKLSQFLALLLVVVTLGLVIFMLLSKALVHFRVLRG